MMSARLAVDDATVADAELSAIGVAVFIMLLTLFFTHLSAIKHALIGVIKIKTLFSGARSRSQYRKD
jgi:hypothetical protein